MEGKLLPIKAFSLDIYIGEKVLLSLFYIKIYTDFHLISSKGNTLICKITNYFN